MATDIDTEWASAFAPVTPNTTQDWVVLVNAERWPTLDEQRRAIENVIKRVGGENVRFERFSQSRIQAAKTRVTRETIPNINFIPTVRGKPVWWLVKWDWFGSEDAVDWPAEQHGIVSRDINPLQADVLLDSVGGLQAEAVPDPSFVESVGDVLGDVKEGVEAAGKGLAVVGLIVGGWFLLQKFGSKKP